MHKLFPFDKTMRFGNVNRVEVIDHTGRAYVLWQDGIRVSAQLQDNDRTLKVFIDGAKPSHE